MNFKIDTKEKFTVLRPDMEHLTAILADEVCNKVVSLSNNQPFNVIVDFDNVNAIEKDAIEILAKCRINLYENNHSFVICNMTKNVLNIITSLKMEDALNITLTESEAWDIVQMDEIEREFMNEEE